MPVFFALSGFFYRQVSNLKMFATNIYKKLISFGIPYLFFSVVYAVLQQFFGNVEQGFQALPRIFWMPIGYLWFLLVLFWIYVLVGIVDLLRVDYRLSLGFYFVLFVVSQLIGMPYIFAAVFYMDIHVLPWICNTNQLDKIEQKKCFCVDADNYGHWIAGCICFR